MEREFSVSDRVIRRFDTLLRSAVPSAAPLKRPSPGAGKRDDTQSASSKRHSAGLMRVNHTGEVCAQALYIGQGLVARDSKLKQFLREAASEELDHLGWCAERLEQLESRPSLLNPAWFAASLALSAALAALSDKLSLAFVEETERQVCAHLDGHLQALDDDDLPSRAIVAAMREDEAQHARAAQAMGARELPWLMRRAMAVQAKVMTTLVYWL